MIWHLSNRFDVDVLPLADRHYNRQKIGTPQFAPPGRCVVLKTAACDAFWVSSYQRFVRHAWAGAWNCSAFRNESAHLSSELIRQAVSATLAIWGEAPALGMITFINPDKVRHKRDPGRCFYRAGFQLIGTTAVNEHIVLQLLPEDMPEPFLPLGSQFSFELA